MQEPNMHFFIIIPIYNVSEYLRECLESCANQSYKHFSAIMINDGSSDDSGAIAREFALRDKRFIYLEQANSGVSSARNNALDYIYKILDNKQSHKLAERERERESLVARI